MSIVYILNTLGEGVPEVTGYELVRVNPHSVTVLQRGYERTIRESIGYKFFHNKEELDNKIKSILASKKHNLQCRIKRIEEAGIKPLMVLSTAEKQTSGIILL